MSKFVTKHALANLELRLRRQLRDEIVKATRDHARAAARDEIAKHREDHKHGR